MDIKTLAALMLIGHLIAVIFGTIVLKRQNSLFKRPIRQSAKRNRHLLFALSLVLMAGNIIPVGIDLLTLVVTLPRPVTVSWLSVLYAISNAYLVAAASSLIMWLIYKDAERSHNR